VNLHAKAKEQVIINTIVPIANQRSSQQPEFVDKSNWSHIHKSRISILFDKPFLGRNMLVEFIIFWQHYTLYMIADFIVNTIQRNFFS